MQNWGDEGILLIFFQKKSEIFRTVNHYFQKGSNMMLTCLILNSKADSNSLTYVIKHFSKS